MFKSKVPIFFLFLQRAHEIVNLCLNYSTSECIWALMVKVHPMYLLQHGLLLTLLLLRVKCGQRAPRWQRQLHRTLELTQNISLICCKAMYSTKVFLVGCTQDRSIHGAN